MACMNSVYQALLSMPMHESWGYTFIMKFSTLIVVLRTVTNTEKKGKWLIRISFRRLVHVQFFVSLSSTYTVEAAPPPRACGEYAFRTISRLVPELVPFHCSYESVHICQSCAHCSGPRKVKVTGKCRECVREPFSICLEYSIDNIPSPMSICYLVMVTVTVFAS